MEEHTIRSLLALGREELGGLAAPRLEAEILLAHVLGRERLYLRLHDRDSVDADRARAYGDLIARRRKGEPSAYLTGVREFFGRDFTVRPGVLIPRPETELVVESALALMEGRTSVRLADLGAGSGCIGINLALELGETTRVTGFLVEKSPAALAVCAANAARYQRGDEGLCLVQADMCSLPLADQSLDLVVANPPYIAYTDTSVEPMVRRYEPSEALFADNDGLYLLQGCIEEAKRILIPGGWVVLEHGWQQGAAVRSLLQAQDFCKILTKKDLGGLDRVTIASI